MPQLESRVPLYCEIFYELVPTMFLSFTMS
jgi:hypothetical protein